MEPIAPKSSERPELLLSMVSDEYLVAIGRVITQWSMMEAILEAAIWQAAGLRNDLGRAMTSQTQVQGKLDLLEAVLSQTKPVLADQFRSLASYVRSCLVGPRNTVTHGAWSTPLAPKFNLAHVVKFHAKGRLVSQGGIRTIPELIALALQIAEVTAWLLKLGELLPKLKLRRGGLEQIPI